MDIIDFVYISLIIIVGMFGFVLAKLLDYRKTKKQNAIGTIVIVYDDETGETYANLSMNVLPENGIHSIKVIEEHISPSKKSRK